MRIQEFRKTLSKRGIGPGARWLKSDFHVHMPGSSDYEYKGVDAVAALGAQLTAGAYDVVVVLKHQQFPTPEDLSVLQAVTPNATLLPGAEINVFVDTMSAKVAKDHFFHAIVIADPAEPAGYTFALEKAKRTFSYRGSDYPAGFTSSILDLGRMLQDEGALFIPAHLHQAKSPEASRSIDDIYGDSAFLGFVREGAFTALEVRQLSTAGYFDGSHATSDGFRIPQAVCVASSDAHHHEHVAMRSRATWLRAEAAMFPEARAALSFPHRVSLQAPQVTYPRILGLHVVGAFIPEAWIQLNEGLNALIGSKGSGKTALLECIRFVLNTGVPEERVESVRRHVGHVLGPGGYVECLVQAEDGRYWLITRRADSAGRITLLDDADNLTTADPSAELPFPINILGWHEIEAIADHPAARIDLLDRIGGRSAIREHYSQIDTLTATAREELPLLQNHMRRLDGRLKELWDLRAKRRTLQVLQETELLDLHDKYEWFLSAEERLRSLLSRTQEVLPGLPEITRTPLEFDEHSAPDEVLDGARAALDELASTLGHLRDVERDTAAQLQASVNSLDAATNAALAAISVAFTAFRDNVYRPKVDALPPEHRDVLARRIQILEDTKRLPTVEQECQRRIDAVRKAAERLDGHCAQVVSHRQAIAELRRERVVRLNRELDDVKLNFMPEAVTAMRERFRSRHKEEGQKMFDSLGGLGSGGAYTALRALFKKLSELGLDQSAWGFNDLFWDVRFLDILDVIDEDDLDISLLVGKAGFVSMKNLSAGQRSVAVFPLLLRNERGPLIIDQPEDNLDNRYIARVIAPDLVRRKAGQQFLVTSHNANLVVLTDADLILHMESDGTAANVPASGFLSCDESGVRDAVLDVLDGGAEALQARQRKYGVAHSTSAT